MTRTWSGEWWAQRRKGIIAALGALTTIAGILWGPDNKVSQIIQVVIPLVTALTVYAVANAPMPVEQARGKHTLREPDTYPDGW